MIPSILVSSSEPKPKMVCVIPIQIKNSVTKRLRGMSTNLFVFVIINGQMRAVTPSISMTLKMLDPMMLPMAMSALPWNAPVQLTTSSGIDVPMPTIVSPMTNSLTPAFFAMLDEPSTSQLAPRRMSISPPIRIRICSNIFNYQTIILLFIFKVVFRTCET